MVLDATGQFIVDLFVLLACSVLAGEVAARLGQAQLVGQLLAGVALGPTLLGPYLGLATFSASLATVQVLAVIFVLFWAGLAANPDEILTMGWPSLLLGLAAFFLPFGALALLVGPLLHVSELEGLYVALTLSITALPVISILLTEFGLRGTKIGLLVLNAALVNEFAAVSIFALLQRLGSSSFGDLAAIATALVSLGIFLGVILAIHLLLKALRESETWPTITRAFEATWRSRQGNFAILMVFLVGATLFSELLGLTYVVGAFYAGLLVTRESAGPKAHRSISSVIDLISWALMIPLFFVFVGVEMNLRLLGTSSAVAAFGLLLVVAVVTKIGAGALVSRATGWRTPDALAIGHLLNSRGAVELAMAVLLFTSGIFNVEIFTLVAAIGLVTTILSPIGATRTWLADPESREALLARVPEIGGGPGRRRFRPLSPWPFDLEGGDPSP